MSGSNKSSAGDDGLVRYFEKEVLDVYYRQLPAAADLWRAPRPEAIYSVVAAYDGMSLVISEVESAKDSFTNVGPYQALKGVDEGFVHALRWVVCGQALDSIRPTRLDATIDAAGQLLLHAAQYGRLTAYHVLYSRGLIGISVDSAGRRVRFEPIDRRSHPVQTFADRFSVSEKKRKASPALHTALDDFMSRVSFRTESGHIVLNNPVQALAAPVVSLCRMTIARDSLPLEGDVDLVGFSMSDFRAFWFPLYCWSSLLLRVYLGLTYGGMSQAHCMPTQVMRLADFMDSMILLSGLARPVIEKMIGRLTYDSNLPKPDPFLTPLIRAGNDLCWSPLSVILSRIERNLLKSMARTPALRDHAALLVGRRERPMLRELDLLLAKHGRYQYKLCKSISAGGDTAEIDLLGWTERSPRQVLLVEGKALLTTDEQSECIAAGDEIAHAQHQITRAARLLRSAPFQQRRMLYPFVPWEQVDSYLLLVVTPDSLFGHSQDEATVPVVTLDSIKAHMPRASYASPSMFCQFCREKPWLTPYLLGPLSYETISVGNVTYEVPFTGEMAEE